MPYDLRDHPVSSHLLSTAILGVRCLGWLTLGLLWVVCLGFLTLGGYYVWWLGEPEGRVFFPLARTFGLLVFACHGVCDLWPFPLSRWWGRAPRKETSRDRTPS